MVWMRAAVAVVLVTSVSVVGCAGVEAFRPDLFSARSGMFTVDYLDAGRRAVIPAPWSVDNFVAERSGWPAPDQDGGRVSHSS